MRYFLTIKYHGAAYHGWQIQKNALSVQQVLNEALSLILREPTVTVGSGRTDTGVHAQGQVAHFESERQLDEKEYLYKLNSVLPRDISISDFVAVADQGHARFSATKRSYQYMIHRKKDPFLNGISYFFSPSLNVNLMNQAGELLIQSGKQDYSSFSKSNTQNSSNDCHIFRAGWHVIGEDRLVFSVSANRFLRGMVRAMVGTMLDIGMETINLTDFTTIIASQNRQSAGRSVDACGLFLTEVTYPADIYRRHD